MEISWETLNSPAVMGALVLIIMQAFGKKFATWLASLLRSDKSRAAMIRGIAINAVTFATAFVIASVRLSASWAFMPVLALSAVATAYAVGEYEALKNIFKMLGWEVEGSSRLRGYEVEGS